MTPRKAETVAAKYLTPVQAGAYVGMHPKTITKAASAGELSGVKTQPGNPHSSWRFTTADLDAWLERGRVSTTSAPTRKRRAS